MNMNKRLIALCLSSGLLASAPGISLADVNYVPQNTRDAPASPSAALHPLTWTPVEPSKTQTTQLSTGGQQLNFSSSSSPVAAYSVPANSGELTLTLTSEVNKQTSVFAPNVLILDQNMTPSAFFPSSYFTYQEPGVMSADRLEGVMRLTPALGAGDSIWSRPAIRVFATYAKWDEKWGYDYTGSSSTNPYYGKAVSADFNGGSFGRGDSDEWTFGAQMEIWW